MSPDRGISDTMGVVLVAALVASLAGAAGVGVVQYQQSQMPSETNAAMGATIDGANVTLLHRGGDGVAASELVVVTRSDEVSRFHGRAATEVVGDGDRYFEPGERWRWQGDDPFAADTKVLLVDGAGEGTSRSVVDTALVRVQTPTPTPTPTTTTTTAAGANAAPDAAFSVSDDTPATGQTVTFDASASSDSDGYVDTYAWDFDGDGVVDATGESVTHAYADDGEYTVTLRVTDDDGATDTATATVRVGNQPPTVSIESSCSSLTCSFTANASDPDGSVESVDWSFGDGASGSGASVTHAYETGGTYDVTVTVTDDDGATTQATTTVSLDGDVRFVSGEAVAPGGHGKQTAVQVTLANRRAADAAVVAVRVSVSKGNVDAIYEPNDGVGAFRNEFFAAASEDGYAEAGEDRAFATETRYSLDQRAVVASGTETTITVAEFGEIRTKCWGWWCYQTFKTRNVNGATVTLEVWFADGTHRTYEFTA